MIIYLDLLLPASSSGTPKSGPGKPIAFLLPCFGWGLHVPCLLPAKRWALTPPSHPYPTVIVTAGGYFLLHWFTLTDDFQLRSRMLYVARTFLLHLKKRMHTASRPTDSYVTRRYKKINVYECRMLKKMYFCKLMKRLAYILQLC